MLLRSTDKQYVNRLFSLFNCEQIDIIVLLDLRFPSTQTSTWDMRHSPTLFSLNIIKPYQLLTSSCWLWWEIAHLFGDSTHLCFFRNLHFVLLAKNLRFQQARSGISHKQLVSLPTCWSRASHPMPRRKIGNIFLKQNLFVYFCNYCTKYTLNSNCKIL